MHSVHVSIWEQCKDAKWQQYWRLKQCRAIFQSNVVPVQCTESLFATSKQNIQHRQGKLLQHYLTFIPASPFLGNQLGQICAVQRTVNVRVSACICMCGRVCVCVSSEEKIPEGRVETEIGRISRLPSVLTCECGWHIINGFLGSAGLECKLEWIMSHSCRTSANFASGFVWNTPLLTSNSCIEVNWANPSSKGCLKFTKCGPCLTKKQVN